MSNNEREQAVNSLMWMGRFNIVASLILAAAVNERRGLGWLPIGMLALCPGYLIYYRHAITRAHRIEAVIPVGMCVGLGIGYPSFVRLW